MLKLPLFLLVLAVTTALAAETVTRVVDGDTIVVSISGREEKVRLIGVDTPETVHPNKPVEYFGKEASAFTRRTAEGQGWITLLDGWGALSQAVQEQFLFQLFRQEPPWSNDLKKGRSTSALWTIRKPMWFFVLLETITARTGRTT